MGDHQRCTRRASSLQHRIALLDGGRHRLLDHDRRARSQQRDRLWGVQRVRGRHDGGIDVGIGGERFPVGRHPIDAVPVGERPSGLLPMVRHRDQFIAVCEDAARMEVLDPAAPEQRDLHAKSTITTL